MKRKHSVLFEIAVLLTAALFAFTACSSPTGGGDPPPPSGPTVYVAGLYSNIPCYWKDGSKTDLDIGTAAGGHVTAITVSGGSVYLAGYTISPNTTPCYWKDGIRTDLDIGTATDGHAAAIAVSGGSV